MVAKLKELVPARLQRIAKNGMLESILIAALLASFAIAWLPGIVAYLTLQPEWSPHAPIHIEGPEGFTAANGVRGGNGSASNPYVISDWVVDMSRYPDSHVAIWFENTDAHVVVRHCRVIHLDADEHYYAMEVGKNPGENATPSIGPPEIDLTSNITFLNNDIESRVAYAIQIAEGSAHIVVRGNRIQLHPDGVAGRNFRYAINTGRNTHDVVIEDNSIDAFSDLYSTVGIHLSDYYVSEARRATDLLARNNTVTNAATGIQVESSRAARVEDNRIYWTQAWNSNTTRPRGIVLRQSALEARVSGNTIYGIGTGIVLGSAGPDNYRQYGSILGASNGTFVRNEVRDVQVGYALGNVSGTTVYRAVFSKVRWMEFDLSEEGGSPRDLSLGDSLGPAGRLRTSSPDVEVPLAFNWSGLRPQATYFLNVTSDAGSETHPVKADDLGHGQISLRQPRNAGMGNAIVYAFEGPPSANATGPLPRSSPPRLPGSDAGQPGRTAATLWRPADHGSEATARPERLTEAADPNGGVVAVSGPR
ncbi:MAG TPA: right-handed parallel beta-helix repeat-containing protein [Thermoplasmata archaeon]|nr:right-handed parallel beta-helix repeat-containing protein [Thermoplasmata archaeon]